ncbi:MAG: glycosyltransferase [Candidatus Nanopelagicaceae bacterium]|nr:glycosyltransferase [Candidatus Nanopelagicaceae bacterium]
MRILHIANFYGPKSGGIRTTLHELGKGYQSKGHEFIYVVPGTSFFCEDTPSGKKVTLPSFVLPFSGGYRVITNNRSIKRLIVTLNPDRIEISDRFTLTGIGKWAMARNIPSVVFSHESLRGLVRTYLPFQLRGFVNWHNRRLASRFTNVIATTNFAAREFREIGTSNLVQIPLGVDLNGFNPNLRNDEFKKSLLKGSKYLMVHCGRLSPEKKPERSIQTLIELQERGFDVRLVYVGGGPLLKKLRAQAKGLPITFLGFVADRKRVAEILAAADFSMAPGPIETFCLAALESLASGTPVIASESSAVGEFLLLESNSPVGQVAMDSGYDFANAVEKILRQIETNPDLRRNCHEQAENFPWSATISLMLRLHGERELEVKAKHRLRAA